jgi:hypothetical protein
VYLEIPIRRVLCKRCGKVKRESLEFLSDNSFYTKRFSYFVGRRFRASSIRDVAKEVYMDWHTVKELEKQYMREQLRRIGTPGPKIIGIAVLSNSIPEVFGMPHSHLGDPDIEAAKLYPGGYFLTCRARFEYIGNTIYEYCSGS